MRYENSKDRMPELNAGSLADIAFLLLVFFLVTADLKEEYHLPTMIPPIDGIADSVNRITVEIWVRNDGSISLNKQVISEGELEFKLKPIFYQGHVLVQLKTQMNVSFEDYIHVLDKIKRSYRKFNEERLTAGMLLKPINQQKYTLRISEVMLD